MVPTESCVAWQGLTLLYLGISPSGRTSKQNLAERIRYHFNGNAYGSTLRTSLGCLLSEKLGIRLQQIGDSGNRIHFAEGEEILSQWIAENAFVTWVEYDEPWIVEDSLIRRLNLPLNLSGNEDHPFHTTLSKIRRDCKRAALESQE